MTLITIIFDIVFCTTLIIVCWFIFVQTIVRIIRHFIDNPIRRQIQSPRKVIDWISIHEGMQVLEIGLGSGTFTIEASKKLVR